MNFKLLIVLTFFTNILFINAQFDKVNASIQKIEAKSYSKENLTLDSLDNKEFILIKDFNDHTERYILNIKEGKATYIKLVDDKKTGKNTSKVFTGDVVKTKRATYSFRFDMLEKQKLPLPLVKTLFLTKQKNTLYFFDMNTKDRWEIK